MRAFAPAALLALGLVVPGSPIAVSPVISLSFEPPGGAEAAMLAPILREAQGRVEAFFGSPFERPVVVDVAPDRKGFDARLSARWQMPATECWMVAAADGGAMPILSPARWATDACEHDGADRAHVSFVLTHELVHAYHGQHNPKPDLGLPEEMGWFVEGLAVLASGQLEEGHLADPRNALAAGRAPARLADAWSGKYRYGVSGTLVRETERMAGRPAIVRALGATSPEELLAALGIAEDRLLAAWRASVAAR